MNFIIGYMLGIVTLLVLGAVLGVYGERQDRAYRRAKLLKERQDYESWKRKQ